MKQALTNSPCLACLSFLLAGCDPGATATEDQPPAGGAGPTASNTICGLAADSPLPEIPTNADGGCVPQAMSSTGTLQGPYGSTRVCVGAQQYYLQINEWNSKEPQTLSYGGDSFFRVTEQQAKVATNGGPSGFPSMFIGANSGHTTARSNLPKQVKSLTTVPTTWNWNDHGTMADSTNNTYNAAYDVWFSVSPEGEPTESHPSGGFLMVWLYDPPNAQPIGGSPRFSGVTIPGISGTWDVWIGNNGAQPCISYVRTEPTLSLSFDLNRFIRDAVENRPGTIQDDWYLTNVFAGFEIWSGGLGLETTSFCAVVP